jgi:small-conductance mechanosensitive channel
MLDLIQRWPDWLSTCLILGGAALMALVVHSVALSLARLLMGKRLGEFGQRLLERIGPPTRLGLLALTLAIALEATPLGGRAYDNAAWAILLGFIAFIGWALIVVIDTAADIYMRRIFAISRDDVLTRKHLTQVQLLRRIIDYTIGFLTFSAMLMTIPAVRQYGATLFASAGVAGLVVGLAARPVLSNLIAGVQLAITQPIRLEDTVQVEGEFGQVEEIRSSYVVLRLGNLRRMVIPLSYFMEKPFQNWTRRSTSLIGTIAIQVTPSVRVDAVRETFLRFVQASHHWDGKTAALHVTDIKLDAIQIRGIVSAASLEALFELECEVREQIVRWLQDSLPAGRSAPD